MARLRTLNVHQWYQALSCRPPETYTGDLGSDRITYSRYFSETFKNFVRWLNRLGYNRLERGYHGFSRAGLGKGCKIIVL